MGVARLSLVFIFALVLVFSLVVFFEPAEAKKSAGTYLTEIGSKQVCGDKLCTAPLTIAEKIAAFLESKKVSEGGVDQQIGRFSEGGVSQQKADKEKKVPGEKGKGPKEKEFNKYQTLEWDCRKGFWWYTIYEWQAPKKKVFLMESNYGTKCSAGDTPPTKNSEMLFVGAPGPKGIGPPGTIIDRSFFAMTKFPNVTVLVGEQFRIDSLIVNYAGEVITVNQDPKSSPQINYLGHGDGPLPYNIDHVVQNPRTIWQDWHCEKLVEGGTYQVEFSAYPLAQPPEKRSVVKIMNVGSVY